MTEGAPEERKYLIDTPTSVHYGADGQLSAIEGYFQTNLDKETAREVLAEGHVNTPDRIHFKDDPVRRGQRVSVGFSKWRSSWDPHAEKPQSDPNLN